MTSTICTHCSRASHLDCRQPWCDRTEPLKPLPDPRITPTLDIPEAGAYLGLNRIASYRAAKAGHLPTVQISERRFKVPTAALRTMLGLPIDGDAR